MRSPNFFPFPATLTTPSVNFSARQHICYSALYAIARSSVRLSVRPSVRHTGGSVNKKAVLSQRRLPWKVSRVPDYAHGYFSILWIYIKNWRS